MTCTDPIDHGMLADYWLGTLGEAEQEPVELHLLACDACGARLREVIALAGAIRDLARRGSLRMIVTDTFLRRAAADGLRVRQYDPPAGGGVQCTVTADDDLLIGRMAADLRGAKRVDLCLCDDRGVEQDRLKDIPIATGAGAVTFQESITIGKALPTVTMVARLVRVEDSGEERLLGEYTFNHTRTMP